MEGVAGGGEGGVVIAIVAGQGAKADEGAEEVLLAGEVAEDSRLAAPRPLGGLVGVDVDAVDEQGSGGSTVAVGGGGEDAAGEGLDDVEVRMRGWGHGGNVTGWEGGGYRLNIEHRTSNIEHRTSNIEHRTSNIEHRTSNIEHRTSNIEHRTSNIEHRTSNIEHRTSNIEHRTSNIEHRTSKTEDWALKSEGVRRWRNGEEALECDEPIEGEVDHR